VINHLIVIGFVAFFLGKENLVLFPFFGFFFNKNDSNVIFLFLCFGISEYLVFFGLFFKVFVSWSDMI